MMENVQNRTDAESNNPTAKMPAVGRSRRLPPVCGVSATCRIAGAAVLTLTVLGGGYFALQKYSKYCRRRSQPRSRTRKSRAIRQARRFRQ